MNTEYLPCLAEMSIDEFEAVGWTTDGVRIRIYGRRTEDRIKPYRFYREAPGTDTVATWLARRVKPLVGNLDVEVIAGDGAVPHGNTTLAKLRGSYNQ